MSTPMVTLPDGVDTNDDTVRDRVERIVRDDPRYGPGWVVAWPRHTDWPDGSPARVPLLQVRPRATGLTLEPSAKAGDWVGLAQRVEAAGLGALVLFDLAGRRAVAAHLTPLTARVRSIMATRLGVEPHQIEVATATAVDEFSGQERLDQVILTRVDADRLTRLPAPQRITQLQEIALDLPDGSNGWLVTEDRDDAGRLLYRLQYGRPRTLPGLVPMADLLPDKVEPECWNLLPLGVTPESLITGIDLAATPHSLLVGPTGSGKTIALLQLAAAAVARGHQLVLVDGIKAGLDFLAMRPWCTGWADDLLSAQAMLERLYDEVGRRKEVLKTYGEVKWNDLPRELQSREAVHPVLVIIDEYASLVIEESVPKSLPKDHPFRAEADERNAARGIIAMFVGKIAREARFVGVHLAIAAQRPDAAILGGELRSNLGAAVQLAPPGKPVSREALTMVFPGEVGPQAAVTLAELDDGSSKGLAVMAAEGGSAIGFRVAYAKPASIAGLLESIGVPKPVPWDVAAKPAPTEPREGEIIPPAPVEVDLGEMSFELDGVDDPFA